MKKKSVCLALFVSAALMFLSAACTKTAQPAEPDATATLTSTTTQTATITPTFSVTTTATDTSTVTPTATLTSTPYSASFRENVSGYNGCTDSMISQDNPDSNYGSFNYMITGVNGANGLLRSLIRFDISSIPAGAVISSAKLTMKLNNVSGSVFGVRLQPVSIGWNESQVTWTESSAGNFWVLGGTLSSANAAMPAYVNPADYNLLEYDITADIVQGWLDNPSQNYGLALKSENETLGNFVTIYTSEDSAESNRPLLEIEYY